MCVDRDTCMQHCRACRVYISRKVFSWIFVLLESTDSSHYITFNAKISCECSYSYLWVVLVRSAYSLDVCCYVWYKAQYSVAWSSARVRPTRPTLSLRNTYFKCVHTHESRVIYIIGEVPPTFFPPTSREFFQWEPLCGYHNHQWDPTI